MNRFQNLFPKDLYHSYIVEDASGVFAEEIQKFLIARGDISQLNSDVLIERYDSFTIADSSAIKSWHSERGLTNSKRVCILTTKFINHDAEQALLKMIEEPKAGTHFFLVVPNAEMLVETIRSRAHVIKIDQRGETKEESTDIFLKSNKSQRIEMVEKMIKDHKNDPNSGGVRFAALELVNTVEKKIYSEWKKDSKNKDLQFSLEELQKARKFLATPGASVKMILEHISLVV